MTIDPRTITFALGITAMYSAIVFASVLRNGARIAGGRHWVAGQSCAAVGLILGAERDHVPFFLSLLVGNAFIMASFALQFEAISRFRRRTYPRRVLYAYVGIVVVVCIALFALGMSQHALLALVPVLDAPMMFAIPIQLLVRQTTALRTSERILVSAYLALAAIVVGRAAATTILAAGNDTMQNDFVLSTTSALLFTAMLGTQTGYLLMTKEETDAELERLAAMDSLTEVWNRRTFRETAARDVAQCRRKGLPFAVVMFDLDHFKKINDAHGHAAGDHVLRAFAACARQALREGDLFGRHGGEEFIALLPATSADAALAVAERVRTTCETNIIAFAADRISVTISVGVACDGDPTESLEAMIERADLALYDAKARGRNCVVASSR